MPRPRPTVALRRSAASSLPAARVSRRARARARSAVKTAHVEAELVAAQDGARSRRADHGRVAPGDGEGLAHLLAQSRRFRIADDARVDAPAGVEAGPIEWPAPRMLPVGPLVNYGYEGEALHLVELRPQRTLADRRHDGRSRRAPTGSCARKCAFPRAPISRSRCPWRRIRAPDPRWGPDIAAARAALPRPLAGWSASAMGKRHRRLR